MIAKKEIKGEDKLVELMKARVDAARIAADGRMEEYRTGRGTLSALLATQERLLDAELELIASPVPSSAQLRSQLSKYEEHLKRMKEIEEILQEQFEVGRKTKIELNEAIYSRLQAEILLEKAKLRIFQERPKSAPPVKDGP